MSIFVASILSFAAGALFHRALSSRRIIKRESDVLDLLNARHEVTLTVEDIMRQGEGQ